MNKNVFRYTALGLTIIAGILNSIHSEIVIKEHIDKKFEEQNKQLETKES